MRPSAASKESGAPEVAWGDSFFFYNPDDSAADRRFPFATMVTKDYPGFDTESRLDRPGAFRLNLAVSRDRFRQLFGFPPAEFMQRRSEFDFAALDRVIPHPGYAPQAWVCVLVPGAGTTEQLPALIAHAYERAVARHRPARPAG
jgi:hypothetical protein